MTQPAPSRELAVTPDLDEARSFLALLDPEASAFTFQVFADTREDAAAVTPWNRTKPFDAIASDLAAANGLGAGIFVTINETDGEGRAASNITHVRALFVDIDADPDLSKRAAIEGFPLRPHAIVESSPGKTHAYWRVRDVGLGDFRALQQRVAMAFGGDGSVCDLPRVMRLPGFLHRKHAPFQTRILATHDAAPYSAAKVMAAFPKIEHAEPATVDASMGSVEVRPEFVDPATFADLRDALFSMASDDRELWIRMGCALRGLGEQGRELWLDWSATSNLHRPAEDAHTWDGLRNDRIGYRAVFAEAFRQGWVHADSLQHRNERTPTIVLADAHELLTHDFPTRETLLAPWLLSQSLTMIYAWRGVGKTHVALGIAHALASGGEFLGWRAPCPVRVLYLDGEMPGISLRDRVAAVMASSTQAVPTGYLRFLTPDLQEHGITPNLTSPVGQAAINAVLGETQVVIVDNLSCLARGGKENEAEGWLPLAAWSLRMRAEGRSVIFIHHAGKGGQQRGTSKREDLLDNVIALRRPSDYRAEQGARFEVHFEKARALFGQDVVPVEARLETQPDGRQAWTAKTVEAMQDAQMIELAQLGLSQADIARELGCHRSTVLRALRKAEAEGRYVPATNKPKKPPGRPHSVSASIEALLVAPPSPCNTQPVP